MLPLVTITRPVAVRVRRSAKSIQRVSVSAEPGARAEPAIRLWPAAARVPNPQSVPELREPEWLRRRTHPGAAGACARATRPADLRSERRHPAAGHHAAAACAPADRADSAVSL